MLRRGAFAEDILGGEGRVADVNRPQLEFAVVAAGDRELAVAAEAEGRVALQALEALTGGNLPDFDRAHAGRGEREAARLAHADGQNFFCMPADLAQQIAGFRVPYVKPHVRTRQ